MIRRLATAGGRPRPSVATEQDTRRDAVRRASYSLNYPALYAAARAETPDLLHDPAGPATRQSSPAACPDRRWRDQPRRER